MSCHSVSSIHAVMLCCFCCLIIQAECSDQTDDSSSEVVRTAALTMAYLATDRSCQWLDIACQWLDIACQLNRRLKDHLSSVIQEADVSLASYRIFPFGKLSRTRSSLLACLLRGVLSTNDAQRDQRLESPQSGDLKPLNP